MAPDCRLLCEPYKSASFETFVLHYSINELLRYKKRKHYGIILQLDHPFNVDVFQKQLVVGNYKQCTLVIVERICKYFYVLNV